MTSGDFDLVVRSGYIVKAHGPVWEGDIGVNNGRVAALGAPGSLGRGNRELDARGLHVLPGAVDPHAHIGLGGGLDEYGPDTGAAALGGVTTVFYILINSGSYVPVVDEHVTAASQETVIDFGYHLTLMTDDHLEELDEIAARWGIETYKYYMSFRGTEGAYLGVEGTDDGYFHDLLTVMAARSSILMVHTENIEIVWKLRDRIRRQPPKGLTDLELWDASRPDFVEAEAIQRAAFLADLTGARIYIVHVSSLKALEEVRRARKRHPSLLIAAETCPHFLTHTKADEVGPLGKVNPPLRSARDTNELWDALTDGTIDTLGSDHVGRRREKKKGTVWSASAGFPGLPTTLPVLLTEGVLGRELPLQKVVELTAERPAQLFGVGDRKGSIAPGFDADFAIVDLQWERTVDAAWLGTWSDYSLYEGRALRGWPRYTVVRGEVVQEEGELAGSATRGRLVTAAP